MADTLKPCPFCGGKARLFAGMVYKLPMIVCTECRATVSFGGKETPKQTKAAWEKRHTKKQTKNETEEN